MLELGLDALVLTLTVPPFSWFNSLSIGYQQTWWEPYIVVHPFQGGVGGGGGSNAQEYHQK